MAASSSSSSSPSTIADTTGRRKYRQRQLREFSTIRQEITPDHVAFIRPQPIEKFWEPENLRRWYDPIHDFMYLYAGSHKGSTDRIMARAEFCMNPFGLIASMNEKKRQGGPWTLLCYLRLPVAKRSRRGVSEFGISSSSPSSSSSSPQRTVRVTAQSMLEVSRTYYATKGIQNRVMVLLQVAYELFKRVHSIRPWSDVASSSPPSGGRVPTIRIRIHCSHSPSPESQASVGDRGDDPSQLFIFGVHQSIFSSDNTYYMPSVAHQLASSFGIGRPTWTATGSAADYRRKDVRHDRLHFDLVNACCDRCPCLIDEVVRWKVETD